MPLISENYSKYSLITNDNTANILQIKRSSLFNIIYYIKEIERKRINRIYRKKAMPCFIIEIL